MIWRGIIDAYKAYLPVTDKTPVITLNEGNTRSFTRRLSPSGRMRKFISSTKA